MQVLGQEKIILDVTAGYRRMWFDKNHPNALFLDQRAEVNPDQVSDFRHLDYPDASFQLVLFDPPHDIRPKPSDYNARFVKDFWFLKPETWASDVKKGLAECWRVLKPNGILIFKWNTMCKKLENVIPLFPVKPLFGQITKGDNDGKKGNSQTFWFCFMKIPSFEGEKKLEAKK